MRRFATLALIVLTTGAAFAMVPDVPERTTFQAEAIQSGPWRLPTTWKNGHVPADGDFVDIPPSYKVTLVESSARIRWIQVRGTLALSPKTTRTCTPTRSWCSRG